MARAKQKPEPSKTPTDVACATLFLDRDTGALTIVFDPQFTRQWEVEYMLQYAEDRTIAEDGSLVDASELEE